MEAARPHSPYVAQRDTLDGGFSKGWGMHFLPSEETWVDVHSHLGPVKDEHELRALLDAWFERLDAYRLGQVILIADNDAQFDLYQKHAAADPRFAWLYWPKIKEPDVKLIKLAAQKGAVGLKLHNHTIMTGDTPRGIYKTPAWRQVFDLAQTEQLPLLWHVTQRTGYSPYHGGGEDAYWSEGRQKGVSFTNEDLLDDFVEVLTAYPQLPVVGAHQLHLGLDRLEGLFAAHPNLRIDSSCGFYLRWADDFIEEDRMALKSFLERHANRILYGTDSVLNPGGVDDYLVMGALCHARFLLRLGLSHEALQKIAHENAATLYRLPLCPSARRGSVRP